MQEVSQGSAAQIVSIPQGTDEWRAARLGKLTASRLHEALAKTRNGWGASRNNLMATLVVERLTGAPQDSFMNAAMQHGINTEPDARRAYAFYGDVDVVEVGFIDHPTISMSGASPDGLVGDEGLVEIKCPSSGIHLETLLGASVDRRYSMQMMWQMACTGRAWCDFVSFDPRMPEDMQLHVVRVHRNDELITELEREARAFLAEVDAKALALRNRKLAA